MTIETVNNRGISRRSVARGAAWGIPAIAVAASAPAVAASGPTVRNAGYVTGVWGQGSCSGTVVTVNGTASANTANPGYIVQNTTKSTKISGITLTFFFPISGLTFTALPGSDSGWPTLASNGATQVNNGVTYYGYSSTYSPTDVTATSPNTTLYYGWRSNCSSRSLGSRYFYANSTATIDGKPTPTNSGLAQMN